MKITKERLKELENIERKMDALTGAGVDNWEGYDFAMEVIEKEEEFDRLCNDGIDDAFLILEEGMYEPSERDGGFAFKEESRDEARCSLLGLINKMKNL